MITRQYRRHDHNQTTLMIFNGSDNRLPSTADRIFRFLCRCGTFASGFLGFAVFLGILAFDTLFLERTASHGLVCNSGLSRTAAQ